VAVRGRLGGPARARPGLVEKSREIRTKFPHTEVFVPVLLESGGACILPPAPSKDRLVGHGTQ
jgi:hypothetical protein